MLAIIVLFILILNCHVYAAEVKKNPCIKDYGIHGHLFEISEKSLLDEIFAKLAEAKESGKLAQLNEEFKLKVKDKINNPTPVTGINKTIITKSWSYDPSYTQKTNIKDSIGRIIVKAGTTVNPLKIVSWGDPLIFIDGEDQQQIEWSLALTGKIVLINGSPLKLSKKHHRVIYFDQSGLLSRHFNIRHVPAIITQDGNLLKVTEINIDKKNQGTDNDKKEK